MQETTKYILFESVVEPLTTKEESRDKMNAFTCRIHNNFNYYYGSVLKSNNDSTKIIKLSCWMVY